MLCRVTDLAASDVDQMVNKVAENIRPFALDVRRGMYDDGKMYLAVVNTVRTKNIGEVNDGVCYAVLLLLTCIHACFIACFRVMTH